VEAEDTAMTVEEYLRASPGWQVKHEWVNGRAWAMTGGRPVHNAITLNVAVALSQVLRGTPCRATSSDQRIEVGEGQSYLYPDVSVICGPFHTSERDALSLTNPTVIVEVLSPGTREYDLGTKLALYRSVPSVTDILHVDPDVRHVLHHARTDRAWLLRDVREGAVQLVGIPGVYLSLDAIYADLDAVLGT